MNTYISPQKLSVNAESGYKMVNSPDYLVQILFNASAQTLANCEVRVCKSRFIVEKTKKLDFVARRVLIKKKSIRKEMERSKVSC